jgi:hypothetical protein
MRRSLPLAPTLTVSDSLATEPLPRATALVTPASTLAFCPRAVPPVAVAATLALSPRAVA